MKCDNCGINDRDFNTYPLCKKCDLEIAIGSLEHDLEVIPERIITLKKELKLVEENLVK